MVLIFGCGHAVCIVSCLEASFLQTLEDVFLKLCRRQEEEKVVEFGESLNIVSSVKKLILLQYCQGVESIISAIFKEKVTFV